VIGAEENDQFAGANAGRATEPTPAGCDGVTVPCNYASGQIGELQANIKGLLSTTASAGTPFDIEPQGASIYVHGKPAAYDHGYYSPNIDVTWVGIAGKGVKVNGVDGPDPAAGNQPHDPESTNTVPQATRSARGSRRPTSGRRCSTWRA